MGKSYVIGDLQGCYSAFVALLDKLKFDESQDVLYLCGDIVARGEDSLATLRLVKSLADKGALKTVLGNHDITLIAAWLGIVAPKPKDKTLPILQASDCDELLNWLRCQPFLLKPNDKTLIVHAGIPPNWTTAQALLCANQLSRQFSGSLKQLKRLLPSLYDKKTRHWHDDVAGFQRLAMISDYLTRMRLCNEEGVLDLKFKSGLGDTMPLGFRPWFTWQVPRDERVFFGHWAALEASVDTPAVRALDGGCVWGGHLVAYNLDNGQVVRVAASSA